MDYELTIVPPGGGETDYVIIVQGAPFSPRPGEYVVLREEEMDEEGIVRAFKVRYSTTYLGRVGESGNAKVRDISVEAEPIFHPHQTKAHRENCEMYQAQGRTIDSYPASGY